jgi:cytidyltransferase-like protein
MNKVEKYILYGASFNPPHIGHFSAISQMLEEYDKVIVFPYPKKYAEGKIESLPPINQRMKMLEVFSLDFFPQMADRLILINLATEMGQKDGILHTYDYLHFVKNQLPPDAELSACLGFESQNINRKEEFFNEDKIKQEFPHFYLVEENQIKSSELRDVFSNIRNVKSKKQEEYIRYAVGNALAEHIFKNNLYGIKNKNFKAKNSTNEEEVLALQSVKTKPRKI